MLPPEVPVGACWACLHGQARDAGVSTLTQWAQGPIDAGLSLHISPPPLADYSETHFPPQKVPVGWSIQCDNVELDFSSQFLSPAPWNYFPNTLPA